MNRRDFIGASAAALPLFGETAAGAAADGWIPLFNGRNLDGWYSFLSKSGKDRDPSGCIRVDHGQIHILGYQPLDQEPEYGYLSTLREFGDCRIRVEYKWGERRYPPRAEYKRDNGILYHLRGPDQLWPICVECQIQESDVGDALAIKGARFVPGTSPGSKPPGLPAWPDQPTPPMAEPRSASDPAWTSRLLRKQGDFEKPDDWNVVEVICKGDSSAHLVNGRIVSSVFDIERPDPADPAKFVRLDRGRIAIEVEYAETWFRRIDVKPL